MDKNNIIFDKFDKFDDFYELNNNFNLIANTNYNFNKKNNDIKNINKMTKEDNILLNNIWSSISNETQYKKSIA